MKPAGAPADYDERRALIAKLSAPTVARLKREANGRPITTEALRAAVADRSERRAQGEAAAAARKDHLR